ncbi:hypothetical protein [Mariniflexile sp. HMF6888]|uniref:hypothetical protein n=1 Tax=Mariniflexile sp. HMF6888 TaxID=3373086 RepID=UPI0037965869
MKKVLISLLVLVELVSCIKENPVEKSIANYVQTNFKDPSSYEKISIKILDTITVAKKIKIYEDRGMSHTQFDNEPKDKFLYYTVNHKYRAKNSFGAMTVYDDIVSMDKNYNITGSHRVNE